MAHHRVLVTLLVVPTTAYAAGALKFTGIEGTSTNKADVTSAGQLLTTEAMPTIYESYYVSVGAPPPADKAYCTALTPALPSGDAYDIQDVYADFAATGQQTTTGSTVSNGSEVAFLVAPPRANVCTTFDYSAVLGAAIPSGGNTGSLCPRSLPDQSRLSTVAKRHFVGRESKVGSPQDRTRLDLCCDVSLQRCSS